MAYNVDTWDELVTICASNYTEIKISHDENDQPRVWDFNELYPTGNFPVCSINCKGKITIDGNGATILRPYINNKDLFYFGRGSSGGVTHEITGVKIINAYVTNSGRIISANGYGGVDVNDCQVSGLLVDSTAFKTDTNYNRNINVNRCGINLKLFGSSNPCNQANITPFQDCNIKISGKTTGSLTLKLLDSRLIGQTPNSLQFTASQYSCIEVAQTNNSFVTYTDTTPTFCLVNKDLVPEDKIDPAFYKLTTEQMHSPSYLQSIGFPCEGE